MLLEELTRDRDARYKNLTKDWAGPISYDPLSFFSVFHVLFKSSFISYRITFLPWLSVVALSFIWTLVTKLWIPENAPWMVDVFVCLQPMGGMLGGTVSILLAFRLARAAVRFYDSRAAAGKIVEICRVVASEALLLGDHDHPTRDDFLRWTIAVPVAVKNYLRGERGAPGDLLGVLPAADAARLAAAPHQPLHCLHRMRALAYRLALSSPADPLMSSTVYRGVSISVDVLTGAMGAMERISLTPLPFSYTAHVRVLILAYLAFLTAVFAATWGWLTPPSISTAAFLLLGTETAATECERPFARRCDHLFLERYCAVVADNIAQILAMGADAAAGAAAAAGGGGSGSGGDEAGAGAGEEADADADAGGADDAEGAP